MDNATPTPQLNLDAMRATRAQIVALVPEQPEIGVQLADAVLSMMDWMELAQAELTTLRARVEQAERERDNDKAAFDAMRPFVAQIEQTIASAAEQIQQAEAVASEIAAERDELASALAGVREASQQYKAVLEQIATYPIGADWSAAEAMQKLARAVLPPGGGDTPND